MRSTCTNATVRSAAASRSIIPNPDTDSIWRPLAVTIGLAHLALGNRAAAEREILAEARDAALGRLPRVAESALVGLTARVHDRGDHGWASELILRAIACRTVALIGLSRFVADRIGVGDEWTKTAEAGIATTPAESTDFLKRALARWDAQYGAD